MQDHKTARVNLCVIIVFIFCALPPAFSQGRSLTERECVLTEGGEVIWDLRSYQWVCCVPIGEDLEKCIPISDKEKLPKTSLKPIPKKGSKVIVRPKAPQRQTD